MRDQIASRYELREKLGGSTTATVWRARDKRRRRDVALKVANDQPTDVSSRRQLAAEADAAGRLDHPNIVPLLDAHIGRQEAALAFGYVGGETLAQRMKSGPIPAAEAASIAADVAAALAHAHSRGVVHRDVKPGNVLIDEDGHARLFDFGISATPEHANGSLVEPGMTSGTLPYMAPEQLAGQPGEPATDVYALGAVLYEMLAGKRPFTAASPEEFAAQQQRPPPPVGSAPPALVELAAAALNPDATARPTAHQFADRLRAWREGRADDATVVVPTVASGPQTALVPAVAAAPPTTRGPSRLAVIGGVLVLVLVVAGALAAFASFSGSAPPQPTTAPSTFVVPPSAPPTAAPVVNNGGGGGQSGGGGGGNGGGGGDNGNHGGNGKGGGNGNGHGKGH